MPWLQSPAGAACLGQGVGRNSGTILAWECCSLLPCPQNSAVAPTRALGEEIGEGRHCLGLCVTSHCHLPALCPGHWNPALVLLAVPVQHRERGLPVAPAGLGTSELATEIWMVMCLKEHQFPGLQTCESQGNICLYQEHQILNSTPDHSTAGSCLKSKQGSLDCLKG